MFIRLTAEEFRLALTEEEIAELGNLDFDGNTVAEAEERISFAIDRAYGVIIGYYVKARANGRAIIAAANKQLQLSISRQMLDSLRDRPNVRMDYDNAIAVLKEAASASDTYAYIDDFEAAGLNVERPTANKSSITGARLPRALPGRNQGWTL